jgi:hypothetical protein
MREWNNAKFSIINFIDTLNNYFDTTTFFVTWNESYIPTYHSNRFDVAPTKFGLVSIGEAERLQIAEDLSTLNIGTIEIINKEEMKARHFSGLLMNEEYEQISFIKYFANLLKQQFENENGIVFDFVLDLRPDLFIIPSFIGLIEEKSKKKNGSFTFDALTTTFSRTHDFDFFNQLPQVNSLFTEDLLIFSDSLTSDLINCEFHYLKNSRYTEALSSFIPHHLFSDHLLKMRLINTHCMQDLVESVAIIRPKTFFLGPVDFTDISQTTLEKVRLANKIFQQTKEKLTK